MDERRFWSTIEKEWDSVGGFRKERNKFAKGKLSEDEVDGSDDGFLYARGFIVAAGKDYYDAVNAKPKGAMMDLECEDMCYISFHVYKERFGDMPHLGISRESCSNKAGWLNSSRE